MTVSVTLFDTHGRAETHYFSDVALVEPSIQLTWSQLPKEQRPRLTERGWIVSGVTGLAIGRVNLKPQPVVVHAQPTHL